MSGLYVHIAYCRRKCPYCDFFSGGAATADWPTYVSALIAELRQRIGEISGPVSTLYFGGGTPSMMPAVEFERLVSGIRDILADSWSVEEFTVEINPEDVTPENIAAWKRGGVNRVSMGVQSLDDGELHFLARNHSTADAVNAAHMLRNNFPNLSLDIMFGIPGQTMDTLNRTIDGLLAVGPDHISAYSLMYEEGTALTARMQRGDFAQAEEELSLRMCELISARLAEAGFEQYEISNYAKPGYHSRHNSSYWDFVPYLGIGPSAHSYDGSCRRRANPAKLKQYLVNFNQTSPDVFYNEETLTEEERREERIMLGLRKREGISLRSYADNFGTSALETLITKATPAIASGDLILMQDSTGTPLALHLSRTGLMRLDTIILSLI